MISDTPDLLDEYSVLTPTALLCRIQVTSLLFGADLNFMQSG
jgi:hypothetical protein